MNYLKWSFILGLLFISPVTSAISVPDPEPEIDSPGRREGNIQRDYTPAIKGNESDKLQKQEQQAPPEQIRMDKKEMEEYNQNVDPDVYEIDKYIYEKEEEEYDRHY